MVLWPDILSALTTISLRAFTIFWVFPISLFVGLVSIQNISAFWPSLVRLPVGDFLYVPDVYHRKATWTSTNGYPK